MIISSNPQALSGRILKKREAIGKNKVSKVSSVISETLRRVSSSFAQSCLVPFSTPSKFHKKLAKCGKKVVNCHINWLDLKYTMVRT